IVVEAEESRYDDVPLTIAKDWSKEEAAAHAIKLLEIQNGIDAVLVAHELAAWSERVLKARPEIPLFIAAATDREARQTSLHWAATSFVLKGQNEKTFLRRAIKKLRDTRLIKKGMRLAVVMGGSHGEGFDVVTVE
ncbi:hypothetical protein HOI18_02410, partial [Candidatus Uhrbacteria bacterium]|nr:hypothetical protein [Candidatus Uhrbacteria bacterium]